MNYPYTVEISSTGNASLLLKPLEENCEPIKEPSKTLSYGERNAMSLILFAYMALHGSEEPDLIVLDDPISSFDADKRYSILYTLFQKPENSILSRTFHDKTILILTHDYPLVADLVLDEKRFGKLHACFLHCDREGNLKEQKIEPRRTMTSNAGLQSFSFCINKKIGACEKHPLVRLSYLRRCSNSKDIQEKLLLKNRDSTNISHGTFFLRCFINEIARNITGNRLTASHPVNQIATMAEEKSL